MTPKALKLANELGITNQHPDYDHDAWRGAVHDEDTLLGYWDWVVQEMRYQNHPWLDDTPE